MLNVIMLNVIMLNEIMLNVIMLNVIILNVVAPSETSINIIPFVHHNLGPTESFSLSSFLLKLNKLECLSRTFYNLTE